VTRLQELAAVLSDLIAEMVQECSSKEHVLACAELAWFTGQPANAHTEQTPTIISSLDMALHRVMSESGGDPDVTLYAIVSMPQAADIREYLYRTPRYFAPPRMLRSPDGTHQYTTAETYRGVVIRPVRRAQCSVLIAMRRYSGESEPRILMIVPLLPDPATQPTRET
jgi:hypothetical protein